LLIVSGAEIKECIALVKISATKSVLCATKVNGRFSNDLTKLCVRFYLENNEDGLPVFQESCIYLFSHTSHFFGRGRLSSTPSSFLSPSHALSSLFCRLSPSLTHFSLVSQTDSLLVLASDPSISVMVQ